MICTTTSMGANAPLLGTGTLQNLVSPLPIVIPPPGSSGADDADHPDSLKQSLGVAAAACRAAILQLRSPGEILAMCGKYAQAPYADVPMPQFPVADLAFSNWDRCSLLTSVVCLGDSARLAQHQMSKHAGRCHVGHIVTLCCSLPGHICMLCCMRRHPELTSVLKNSQLLDKTHASWAAG